MANSNSGQPDSPANDSPSDVVAGQAVDSVPETPAAEAAGTQAPGADTPAGNEAAAEVPGTPVEAAGGSPPDPAAAGGEVLADAAAASSTQSASSAAPAGSQPVAQPSSVDEDEGASMEAKFGRRMRAFGLSQFQADAYWRNFSVESRKTIANSPIEDCRRVITQVLNEHQKTLNDSKAADETSA